MTSWLITGGTGSLGQALVRRLLAEPPAQHDIERVIVYSRDEFKQHQMAEALGDDGLRPQSRIRFFLGDVRDRRRLALACRNVQVLVHAAALKQVPALEYNPSEAIDTNISGTRNVIEAALACGVQAVVGISSDKACQPINLYGATKLVAEKLLAAAPAYAGRDGPRFGAVRYGNVSGSRGSVIPKWRALLAQGQPLPVTDLAATRFWITLEEAVDLVLHAVAHAEQGEVFIPRPPAYDLGALVCALDGAGLGPTTRITGLRPGEKLHEWLIGADEERSVREEPPCYVLRHGTTSSRVARLTVPLSHSSDRAPRLTVDELRRRLAALEL